MTHTLRLRNPRILMILLVLAFGVMLIGFTSRLWTIGDTDGHGMFPAQDCGRNYWLFLHAESGHGKDGCIPITSVKAEDAEKRATDEMTKDGKTQFNDAEDAVHTLRDYVGYILEKTWPAW